MYTVSKFSLGISRINRGCGGFGRPVAWHGIQLSIEDLTSESIKGNQAFSRIRLFVLTMPWWPTWAKHMASARKLLGITMRVSRKMMFLSLVHECQCLCPWTNLWCLYVCHKSFCIMCAACCKVGSFCVASLIC